MTAVLRQLMSTLQPPVDDTILQIEADGELRFVYDEKFIIHLLDDSAEGDIRLVALSCVDAMDESLEDKPTEIDQWDFVDSVNEGEFSHFVLAHRNTGVSTMVSFMPRASLHSVSFNAWLESFLPAVSCALHFAEEFRADVLRQDRALAMSGDDDSLSIIRTHN